MNGVSAPVGAQRDTTRGREAGFFLTPDTEPPGLSVRRSRLVAPLLLVGFAVAAAMLNRWLLVGMHDYALDVAHALGVGGAFGAQKGRLAQAPSDVVRPLYLALIVVVTVLLSGTFVRRLRFFVVAIGTFAALCLASDVTLAKLAVIGASSSPFGILGNAVAGVEGIVALAAGVFASAALPKGVSIAEEIPRWRGGVVLATLGIVASVTGLLVVLRYLHRDLAAVERLPVLAGIGSVVLLFFGILAVFLYLLDRAVASLSHGSGPLPSVAIVVPAQNEAGVIGDTIASIDDAAAEYPAVVRVYVVENGSKDATLAEAKAAVRAMRHARGVVLTCPPRGKAAALNRGISAAKEEIVLRIDADTVVTSSVLRGLLRHFYDPRVGGTSGMPLPRSRDAWICRMRAVEVIYQVGFKRSGYNVVDAINVLPGALVAYRRELLLKLNGFAQGINGEDADMTVRVGRLGYRVVSDPTVRAYTEMPTTFAYLREQRMRWSRGTYHMLARNKSAIFRLQGLRSVWMLPWAGFVMLRRLMILPFAFAALTLVLQTRSFSSIEEVAAGGAILLGFQLLQMAACMAFFGEWSLIAELPSYVVFRLIVSFYALETLLGLSFRRHEPIAEASITAAASVAPS